MDMERKGQVWAILEVGPANLSYGLDVDVTERLEDKPQASGRRDAVWNGTTCQHGDDLVGGTGVCGKVKPEPPGHLR